jgi:hypothetical protein
VSDTYKGESLGKKLARLHFWKRCQEWFGDEFTRRKHLVLASREGGDIAVLKGLGVPASNIVAVDRESSAVVACRDRHPDVRVLLGEAADVAAAERLGLGTVFLDFCSWLTSDALACAGACARLLPDHGLLGVAFMRGREKGAAFDQIILARGEEAYVAARENATGWISGGGGLPFAGGDGRTLLLTKELDRALGPRDFVLGNACIDYHSRRCEQQGVPMRICLMHARKLPRYLSASSVRKKRIEKTLNWYRAISEAEQLFRDGDNKVGVGKGGRVVVWPPHTFGVPLVPTHELVRTAARLDAAYPGRAHLLLNVAPGQLAAWRAHATRGSYDKAR